MLQHTVHEIASPLLALAVHSCLQSFSHQVLLVIHAFSDFLGEHEETDRNEDERVPENATHKGACDEEFEDVANPVVVGSPGETVEGLAEGEVAYDVESCVVVPLSNAVSRSRIHPLHRSRHSESVTRCLILAPCLLLNEPKDRLTISPYLLPVPPSQLPEVSPQAYPHSSLSIPLAPLMPSH